MFRPFPPAPLASVLGGIAALMAQSLPAAAQGTPTAISSDCTAPRPGRYVGFGRGEALGTPVAVLLREDWNADGTIRGLRLERRGRTFTEAAYDGSFRPISGCRVAIERMFAGRRLPSQAVLDRQGRPRFGLALLPEVVVTSSWVAQPQRICNAALLDGTVLSQQEGLNWKEGRWRPNAVIQREQWRNGSVRGLAISSYGPRLDEATYTGTIAVGPDCMATVKQQDSLGVNYNYRAIVRSDGGGYFYLQTDPDDLTVGQLDRLGS